MVKIAVNPVKKDLTIKPPCLVISKRDGTVTIITKVIITGEYAITWLCAGNPYGEIISSRIAMEHRFAPFIGSVTLTQE